MAAESNVPRRKAMATASGAGNEPAGEGCGGETEGDIEDDVEDGVAEDPEIDARGPTAPEDHPGMDGGGVVEIPGVERAVDDQGGREQK